MCSFQIKLDKMPTAKDVLALRWANKTEEEKALERKKTSERIKKLRAKNGRKKRSEMGTDELVRQRVMDKNSKKEKRNNMTDEQKLAARAKDRERKARKISKSKEDEKEKREENDVPEEDSTLGFDWDKFEKMKIEQNSKKCRIQQNLRAKRTEAEEEEIQIKKVKTMREKRSKLRDEGRTLARIHAKEGMREWRKFGYLREYKQRKRRHFLEPECLLKNLHATFASPYFEKVKQNETEQERREEKKRKNRMRVEKYRKKIKKMLQDPVKIENYGEKSEYELFRDRNILERERLMKESGLFD